MRFNVNYRKLKKRKENERKLIENQKKSNRKSMRITENFKKINRKLIEN